MQHVQTDTTPDQLRIVCPYCGMEWTAEMEARLVRFSAGCPTCGFGDEVVVDLDIVCSHCGKLVYRKEVSSVSG